MENAVGSPVIYYTHEQNELQHRVNDFAAIVTRDRGNGLLDLTVFPPLSAPYWVTVGQFDPKNVGEPGMSFWRESGSAAPDFAKAYPPPTPEATAKPFKDSVAVGLADTSRVGYPYSQPSNGNGNGYEKARAEFAAKQKYELDQASVTEADVVKARQATEREEFDRRWKRDHPTPSVKI